jgi:heme exporter protein D
MNWSSPSDFFAMGGYAVYVWGAYGVTAACMLADPILAARRLRQALRDADAEIDLATGAEVLS